MTTQTSAWRRIAVVAAVAVVGGAIAYSLYGGDEGKNARETQEARTSGGVTAPATMPRAWGYAPGQELTYRLELSDRGQATAKVDSETKLEATLELTATLVLTCLEVSDDEARIDVQVAELQKVRWTFLGQSVPKETIDEVFGDGRTVMTVGRDGAIRSFAYPKSTHSTFASTIEKVMRTFQPVLASGPTWDVELAGGLASGSAHFEVGACGETCGLTMTRPLSAVTALTFLPSPAQFDTVDGEVKHSYAISAEGLLARADVSETLSGGKGELQKGSGALRGSLVLQRTRRVPVEGLAPSDLVASDALESSAQKDALRRRAGSMTLDQIRADVLEFGVGGRMPHHEKWLWQATGLLLLHPELSAEIGKLVVDPAVAPKGKALLLDLLGNVGHPEAQAAMRAALADPTVRDSAEYAAYVQRFVHLKTPVPETLDFVEKSFASHDDAQARYASATALGALVSQVAARDPEEASRRTASMAKELGQTADPEERRAMLTGLGNAGLQEHYEQVSRFVDDEELSTRVTAIKALRKVDSPASRAKLMDVVASEPEGSAQAAAIDILAKRQLDESDLATLTNAVHTGQISDRGLERLVRLCERRAATPGAPISAIVGLLDAMKRRRVEDRRIANLIGDAYGRISASN